MRGVRGPKKMGFKKISKKGPEFSWGRAMDVPRDPLPLPRGMSRPAGLGVIHPPASGGESTRKGGLSDVDVGAAVDTDVALDIPGYPADSRIVLHHPTSDLHLLRAVGQKAQSSIHTGGNLHTEGGPRSLSGLVKPWAGDGPLTMPPGGLRRPRP